MTEPFILKISGIQKLSNSKVGVTFDWEMTMGYDFDLQMVKYISLLILKNKYDFFKMNKVNNFNLINPIKLIVFKNNKKVAVLTQEKVEQNLTRFRNNETPVVIDGKKYLLKPFDISFKNSHSALIGNDFNSTKVFNTVEFQKTIAHLISSPIKSSSFESNKKKH